MARRTLGRKHGSRAPLPAGRDFERHGLANRERIPGKIKPGADANLENASLGGADHALPVRSEMPISPVPAATRPAASAAAIRSRI